MNSATSSAASTGGEYVQCLGSVPALPTETPNLLTRKSLDSKMRPLPILQGGLVYQTELYVMYVSSSTIHDAK